MDKQQEFALRTVEERDVRFIRLWFTDVLGTLKSVAIAPAELEAAFEEGLGFDGSAVEGLTRVSAKDGLDPQQKLSQGKRLHLLRASGNRILSVRKTG